MKLRICSDIEFFVLKNMKPCKGLSKSISIDALLGDFILLFPVNGDGTLSFSISENFFSESDENFIKADLKSCFFIYAVFKSSKSFKTISQQKTGGFTVTVVSDNGYKIYIESENSSYVLSLSAPSPEIKETFYNGENYLLISDGKKHTLLNKDLTLIESFYADEVLTDNFLSAIRYNYGITRKKIVYDFCIENGKLKAFKTSVVKEKSGNNPTDYTLPFAFLEDLFCGEDISGYLSEEMIEKKDFLRDFFTGAIGISTPPEDLFMPMLIYKKRDNVYYAKYFSCKITGGKIAEIKLI